MSCDYICWIYTFVGLLIFMVSIYVIRYDLLEKINLDPDEYTGLEFLDSFDY